MERDEKRLHICLGVQCNNNCIFCMEDDREGRRRRLAQIDSQAVMRILETSGSRSEVMFTAGEPTLRPDLPLLVRHARKLGYRQIGIITNARRLAYREYAKKLVEAGVNYILVSIHGHTAKLHDGLTRTPGSFEQTVVGLTNLSRIAKERAATEQEKLKLVTTTVLNKRNMLVVAEMVEFLMSFEPDQVVFNYIQPVGRGERYFDRLVPRYSDAVAHFGAALQRLKSIEGIFLLDVPRCVSTTLPLSVLGFVESHRHFEPSEEVMMGLKYGSQGFLTTLEDRGRRLTLVTKEGVDKMLRTYSPACLRCSYYPHCEGVWKAYVARYGFDEFRPLNGAADRDGRATC